MKLETRLTIIDDIDTNNILITIENNYVYTKDYTSSSDQLARTETS